MVPGAFARSGGRGAITSLPAGRRLKDTRSSSTACARIRRGGYDLAHISVDNIDGSRVCAGRRAPCRATPSARVRVGPAAARTGRGPVKAASWARSSRRFRRVLECGDGAPARRDAQRRIHGERQTASASANMIQIVADREPRAARPRSSFSWRASQRTNGSPRAIRLGPDWRVQRRRSDFPRRQPHAAGRQPFLAPVVGAGAAANRGQLHGYLGRVRERV